MDINKLKKLIKYPDQYRIINAFRKANNDISFDCIVSQNTVLEGYNKISNCNIAGSEIGFATYIGSGYLPNSRIGRFCSISYNVCVEPSTHSMSFISTYPGFYSPNHFPYNEAHISQYLTTDDGYYCIIGNDVWIGKNVLIKGGGRNWKRSCNWNGCSSNPRCT